MSLILDALKKSEQERRRDKGPDLQTIHQPAAVRAPRRSNGLLWAVTLVALNAAVLGYWWLQRSAPVAAAGSTAPLVTAPPAGDAQVQAAPAVAAPAARTPAEPAVPTTATQAPLPAPAATATVQAEQPEYTNIVPGGNVAAGTAAAGDQRIEEVDELPEDVRNNLPAMTFSFHVFSSNPQQRTIIINNRRMREGEEISGGLVLQQITEDGVVLLFAQHRIHISVLSGW